MAACGGTWGVYIQADEVLHESGAPLIRDALHACDGEPHVEGLLVDYLHFYGDFRTIATDRHWYRREVRVVRLGGEIRSYRDAQGFRVGAGERRVRARATGAPMFHYGWALPPRSLRHKALAAKEIFTDATERWEQRAARDTLDWTPLLRPFTGTHPRVAQGWIAAQQAAATAGGGGPVVGPRRFRPAHLRLYLSHWIERLTGRRPFEYRNYRAV
jgi:hypothetical protein